MAEFLLLFSITLIILCILAAAMYFGRPPVYQISREQVLEILQNLLAGELVELKWLVFIGHVIHSDPELNEIRLQCQQIEEAAEQGEQLGFSGSAQRYNRAGQEQIKLVLANLEKLIAQTPVYQEF